MRIAEPTSFPDTGIYTAHVSIMELSTIHSILLLILWYQSQFGGRASWGKTFGGYAVRRLSKSGVHDI